MVQVGATTAKLLHPAQEPAQSVYCGYRLTPRWEDMQDPALPGPFLLRVGGLTRVRLVEELRKAEVLLNASAETLLEDVVFDQVEVEDIQIVVHTVSELGFADGATLPELFAAAQERGLLLCPPATGPYLRLSMLDQKAAPDSIMSDGRAPSGSITIASAPTRETDDYPKGFYLRVVDGVPWLRAYQCTDQHTWSPQDLLAFRLPSRSG
jgi:hypothetical protein